MFNVGHSSIRESQRLARHAADIGADAISSVAAFYFKPGSTKILVSEPDARIAQQHFLSLDLTMPKSHMVWEIRPAFPGPPRMLAVAGSHDGSIYVFSGIELYHDVRENKIARRYLKDAYRFNPKNGWQTLRDLPEAVAAAPSPAFNAGQSRMLIFSGDDGRFASRVMELKENHPGFSSSVIAYHTGSDTWSETGRPPQIVALS